MPIAARGETSIARVEPAERTTIGEDACIHSVDQGETSVPSKETSVVRILHNELHRKDELLHHARQQLQEAVSAKESILRSRSWRIMAPARFAGRCFRKYCPSWLRSFIRYCLQAVHRKMAVASPVPTTSSDRRLWMERFEEREIEAARFATPRLRTGPLMSILMPAYNTEPAYLKAAIESVQSQFYRNWELCIGDDASTNPETTALLASLGKQDSRIHVSRLPKNGGISAASNEALRIAHGEFCVLMDSDDELMPHALYEMAEAIQANPHSRFFYSDEDKIDTAGNRYDFFFKPDWSPDLFSSCNYLNHLTMIQTELLRSVGGFRSEYDGSQDYDLYLRVTEETKTAVHIPKVLYHWRACPGSGAATPTAKMPAHTAAQRALQESFRRRDIPVTVEEGFTLGHWRVRYERAKDYLVSILMPTGGNLELLQQCLQGLKEKTSYKRLELILADNSRADAVKRLFDQKISKEFSARYLDFRDEPFNYSVLNNRAAEAATGELLLLLNDDVFPINHDWLEAMIEHAQRPQVGAVGAKLLYPDNTIQHAGVVAGLSGCCDHAFRWCQDMEGMYFGFPQMVRNCIAVTAACLMLRKEVFQEVNGFDEKHLPVAFQDVDLCLKIAAKGYYNVYTPHARLYHHESVTKTEKIPTHAERIALWERWSHILTCDPFYNHNLARRSLRYDIRTESGY